MLLSSGIDFHFAFALFLNYPHTFLSYTACCLYILSFWYLVFWLRSEAREQTLNFGHPSWRSRQLVSLLRQWTCPAILRLISCLALFSVFLLLSHWVLNFWVLFRLLVKNRAGTLTSIFGHPSWRSRQLVSLLRQWTYPAILRLNSCLVLPSGSVLTFLCDLYILWVDSQVPGRPLKPVFEFLC